MQELALRKGVGVAETNLLDLPCQVSSWTSQMLYSLLRVVGYFSQNLSLLPACLLTLDFSHLCSLVFSALFCFPWSLNKSLDLYFSLFYFRVSWSAQVLCLIKFSGLKVLKRPPSTQVGVAEINSYYPSNTATLNVCIRVRGMYSVRQQTQIYSGNNHQYKIFRDCIKNYWSEEGSWILYFSLYKAQTRY